MDFIEQINDLRSKGVTIDFSNEWYTTGINCNWSVTFHNYLYPAKPGDKTDAFSSRTRQWKTGWYGDNHEYGEVAESMKAAVKFAYFMLENEEVLKMYFSNFKWDYPNYQELEKKLQDFFNTIITEEYKELDKKSHEEFMSKQNKK